MLLLPLLPLMTPLLLLLSNSNVHGYGAELWAKAEAEAESKVELVLHKIFSRLHNTRGLGTEHRTLSRVQKQYAVVKNWLIRFPLIPLALSACLRVYLFGLMRFSGKFSICWKRKCLVCADDEVRVGEFGVFVLRVEWINQCVINSNQIRTLQIKSTGRLAN